MANKSRETANLVSSKTGIAVTLSGDPVVLGVGNTQHVAIHGSGRTGIGTVIAGGSWDVYKLEVYGEGNDVLSGSIRAINPSNQSSAGAYVTVQSGTNNDGAGAGFASWSHQYTNASLRGSAGLIAFSNSNGLTISAGTAGQSTRILGESYVETARFTSDNKVGIGTTIPGGPLHILGGGSYIPQIISEITGSGTTANFIRFKDPGGNTAWIGHGSNDNHALDLWNETNAMVRIATNNTERVRVISDGTIGIGTNTSSNYTVAIRGTADNPNPTHGSLYLYGTEYAFIGFNNDNNDGGDNWFIGHLNANSNNIISLRYGSGPANSIGSLYLHKGNMVSVGSAATTGDPNTTFQVMNGGAYFAKTVSIGKTVGSYGNDNYSLVTDDRIFVDLGYDITPGSTYDAHITARFNGYSGGIAGDSSTMYLGHNSSGRDLSFQTNETTRMVIHGNTATVGIGYTSVSALTAYSLALYNGLYMRSANYVDWNAGDARIGGNTSSGGYGLNVRAYNATLGREIYSIYTSGTNKSVGINTTYTSSAFGLYVQEENGTGYGSGYKGAIYSYGNLWCNAGLYLGGLGAITTGGTSDFDHSTNARSGMGYSLLYGTATNGPGVSVYFHVISFEYSSKNGNGNMTQLAIPYSGSTYTIYYRTRYSGVWSSWHAL